MAEVIALQKNPDYDHSEWLPSVARILEISRVTNTDFQVDNRAKIIGDQFEGTLRWTSQHADVRLQRGVLAKIQWPKRVVVDDQGIPICRLVYPEQVDHSVNLFDTIPASWVKDRELIKRGRLLWQGLPPSLQLIFNEIFWDNRRFHRFAVVPASLNGHHNGWNGNLYHAVEVAEYAKLISKGVERVSQPLVILAGLIHDAGKADEYRLDNRKWFRTDTGRLVGHKDTLKGWLGAIFERSREALPEELRLGLWHALFSAKNAPAYLDIREACMLEAEVLSMADRFSATSDLHEQVGADQGGFGLRHDHLRARPFRLPALSRF